MSVSAYLAGPAESARLAALHEQCFDAPWKEEVMQGLFAGGAFAVLAAPEPKAEAQSFVLLRVAECESEILSFGTAPSFRRQGLARAAFLAGAEEAQRRGARELFLEVGLQNSAALSLYRAVGFRPVGQRVGYYAGAPQSGADALILRANLPLQGAAIRLGNEAGLG